MTTAATQALPDKSVPVGTIVTPPAPTPNAAPAAPAAAPAAATPAPAAQAPPAAAKPVEPAPAKPAEPAPAVAATPEAEVSPWDTSGTPAPAAAATPTKIELKAPEGMTVEPAVLQEVTKRATDLGLTQQQAEKYLVQSLSDQKAAKAAEQKQIKDTNQLWIGQLRKEWGTEFGAKAENVKRGLADLDPNGDFQKVAKAAELINAPSLVKLLERHGARIAEDKLGVHTAGRTDPKMKMTPQQKIEEEKKELLKQHPPGVAMGQRK